MEAADGTERQPRPPLHIPRVEARHTRAAWLLPVLVVYRPRLPRVGREPELLRGPDGRPPPGPPELRPPPEPPGPERPLDAPRKPPRPPEGRLERGRSPEGALDPAESPDFHERVSIASNPERSPFEVAWFKSTGLLRSSFSRFLSASRHSNLIFNSRSSLRASDRSCGITNCGRNAISAGTPRMAPAMDEVV